RTLTSLRLQAPLMSQPAAPDPPAAGGAVRGRADPGPTLLRLADTATRRAEALVRVVHDGTLGVGDLEPTAHAGLDGRELVHALSDGLIPLGDCWPALAPVACSLGGSAGIQARHLDAHFGPWVARCDLGLVASEGRVSIPVEDDAAAGVLAVHAGFFEFVLEEAIDDPAPNARCSVTSWRPDAATTSSSLGVTGSTATTSTTSSRCRASIGAPRPSPSCARAATCSTSPARSC